MTQLLLLPVPTNKHKIDKTKNKNRKKNKEKYQIFSLNLKTHTKRETFNYGNKLSASLPFTAVPLLLWQ